MKIKPSQLVVHFISWIPLAWLVYAIFTRRLGGDPQEKVLENLGLWGLIFLLLSFSMTPARKIYSKIPWVRFRRALGLYGAFYIFLHLLTYMAFFIGFDFSLFGSEIIERPYITVGILAVILLTPLVFTSTKASQKRLGKNWKKLHKLVYIILPLGVTHFIWQSKSDLNEPFIYIVWLIILLVFRSPLYKLLFQNKLSKLPSPD